MKKCIGWCELNLGMCIVLVYCCESVTNNAWNEQYKFTVKLLMVTNVLYLLPPLA